MSSQPAASPSSASSFIERLVPKHREIGYTLIGVGVALCAIPIANGVLYRNGSLTTLIWGALLSLLVLGFGIAYTIPPLPGAAPRNEANALRIVLLGVIGGAGFLTALYGVALALSSKPYFAQLDYPELLAGGIKKWRDPENGYQNAWGLARCLGAIVLGLVLMFAGLQLARTFERSSQGLRRLLYGYNAILSSLLLGFILLLINVMSYSNIWPFKALGMTDDWTGAREYSVSDRTENLLTSLKEPVKVYLLLSNGDPIIADAESLLQICREKTDQFSWETLSPEYNTNRLAELMKKYRLSNPRGMLVVYGREPNQSWDFTPAESLRVPNPMSRGQNGLSYLFKGEEFLQKALVYLTQNKSKTVVYFTQGHGELDVNSQEAGAGAREGVGLLAEELRKRNYDVRPLKLGPTRREVPSDAGVVVIIDPREGYRAEEEKALRDYLQGRGPSGKKGHVLLLADVQIDNGRMQKTGLEGLLAEHGVRLQNDRLLNLGGSQEMVFRVTGMVNPQSNNPMARSFTFSREAIGFQFEDVRTLEKAATPGSSLTVDPLVVTWQNQALLRQTDLSEPPLAFLRDLGRRRGEINKHLLEEPATLAFAVSEGNPLANIPGHENVAGGSVQPRLVVFGDATWVSNTWMERNAGIVHHANLFASCLAWLHGRPDIGADVTSHERQLFTLNATPGTGSRLILLPISLLLVAVLAMGLGVWAVRRR